jgi:hypothetical protein
MFWLIDRCCLAAEPAKASRAERHWRSTVKVQKQWQAKFRDWVGGSKYGPVCLGVRRRGRGEWLDPKDAPKEVCEYLELKPTSGRGMLCCSVFATTSELEADGQFDKFSRYRSESRVLFTVEEERPERKYPMNAVIKKLFRETCSDSLWGIYRAAYDTSTCGVTVGFLIGESWVYCGSLKGEAGDVYGISVGGYVEGWDGECDARILQHNKHRRVTTADFWATVDAADEEAKGIWDSTHGCDDCWGGKDVEGCYGLKPIDPACKTCHGEGAII